MSRQLPLRPEEIRLIQQRWSQGVRDCAIAHELGRSQSVVWRARQRLGLSPNARPGRPRTKGLIT